MTEGQKSGLSEDEYQAQIRSIQQVFAKYDHDGSGKVRVERIPDLILNLGRDLQVGREVARQLSGGSVDATTFEEVVQTLKEVEETQAETLEEEEFERLQKLSLEQQKKGVAPLPVVRLCFVGRGRAGKTTTLRRLKGESFRHDEPSTHGLDVWAGQVEADLQADLKQTPPWKRWKESMHLTALKDVLQNPLPQGPETNAHIAQNVDEQSDGMMDPQGLIEPEEDEQPDTLLESSVPAQPSEGMQEDISFLSLPKMCGPVVLDEDMLSKLGSQKTGIDVRLQCWDFPGQEEYAVLNQLHFSERAIYLVFLDLTGQIEDEWRHLSFWLWKIVRFSTENDAWPPIFLIGTKAGASNRRVTESELQERLEKLQNKVPRLKVQLQPHLPRLSKFPKCPWLFPIENKGDNFEAWISPLRLQLQRIALQFVSPPDLWEAENSNGSVVPRFVGVQAKSYPLTWLRAHDLLTRLGSGFRALAERVDVKKVAPTAEPGQRFKIKDYLRVTIDRDWLTLPPGACIRLHSQDEQDDDLREEELSLDVSCDFLELKAVQGLLRGMQPQGLSHKDTEKVLHLLNTLGIVVWIDKAKLRDTVMLNPRQVAVAMANLIALCFGANNFEHEDSEIKVIRKIEHISESDILRFRSSGIATEDLIRGVWKKDFDEKSQQLLQEVLLRNGLMFGRLVQDEFVLPSCLPVAHCAEEAFRETDEVLYLDVGGFLSPNFFPALAHLIYHFFFKLENSPTIWKPGPPQVFRNRGDLHSDAHSVFTSMFPVNAPSNQSLLRILVRGKDQKANCAIAQEVKRVVLNDILGFHPGISIETDPDSFFRFKSAGGKETLERERSFARHPCLNSQCNLTCSLCRVSDLLQERFLPDLSPGLRSIVENAAVQRHTRPAGSFRFKAMQFPGDVDLEEYLVIDAKSKDEALPMLCRTIQKIFRTLSARNSEVQVFMGGLKAGSNPRQNAPGVQKEWLKWSQKELGDCKKAIGGVNEAPGVMTLREALEEGHETWTAKIDMFAKVCLFEDSEATPRFFEITNVLRAGYFERSKPIQPITKEKDSLQGIEMNLKKYASEEPNAMKYVKRLWERSAYLAERGFDLDWHANMLEALQPLLSHWSAELSQIAAHVETLVKMMKSGRGGLIDHALDDLPTLCQSLCCLQSRLQSEKGSEKEAAQDGLERIQDAMKYIPQEPPSESGTEKKLCEGLRKAQLLLESCVETVVISKLGSFEFPVAKRLGELWQFPSDHPPIAAKLTLGECSINVASWNVLNRNYYKYIDADMQGLKGSQITTLHEEREAETRENVIIEKIQEMLLKTNIHILCLQECWPELVAELEAALGESLQFELICSGDEQDKNKEVIVFHSKLSVLYVHHHAPFSENSKKVVTEVHFQLEMDSFRVVTTHVPGAPFGCARREFADCLAEIVNGETLPTVLMADLNFPEKAVHPLLLDRGLEDVYFVPTPYPTNICQGSLLPKRIDSIAVINHQVAGSKLHASAMGAKELLHGLDTVVELLQSRSAEPLTPTRYHSDKVETDAEKISRLERELHAARQRVKYLLREQNEEKHAKRQPLPRRPTDAPSGHFQRKVTSVHRVEPDNL